MRNFLQNAMAGFVSKSDGIKRNLAVIFFFVFIISLNATPGFSQKDKITLNVSGVSIETLFDRIENTTDYRFAYKIEDLDLKRKVSVKVVGVDVITFLKKVFPDQSLSFEISGNQVIIKKKQVKIKSSSVTTNQGSDHAVQKIIKGTVINQDSIPLPGVNVLIKDQNKGTITNMDGEYEIEASNEDVLVFSFIGYERKEIKVGSKEVIHVKMKLDNELSEVVITSSYGTKERKEEAVSSVYQVEEEQLKNLPSQRIDKLLDGIVPGLQFSPQSDNASSARPRYSVTIRGEASLAASNEPLWIVDGTPIHTGNRTNMIRGVQTSVSPLSYLNPEDIESISVLKDASATSLYGADGANGVILINTKKGKAGKLQFNVSARHGQSFINESTRFEVLNGKNYFKLAKEAYQNAGKDMKYFPFNDNDLNEYSATNVDWYDLFYDRGNNSQINLSASGGSERSTFYVSGSYFQDKSTLIGNKQERFSIRTRNNVELNDKMDIDLSLGASYNTNNLFSPGDRYYENLPIISPYNSDGTFRQYYRIIDGSKPDGSPNWVDKKFFNGLAEREQNDNQQNTFAFQGNFKFRYEPIKNISYTGQFGMDYQSNNENIYRSMKNWSGKDLEGEPLGVARASSSNFLKWTMIHRVNFDKKIGVHNISGVIGFEMASNENRTTGSYGTGFVNDHLRVVTYASDRQGNGNFYQNKKMSYLAQVSYSFDQRYNATANVRKDGNSNFGKDVRWAEFASVGVSWNIHKEEFFKSDKVNVLSVKGSYGSNGNSRIGDQEALGVYAIGENYDYAGESGAGLSISPNPKLSWETTYMTNLGVHVAAFDRRIDLNLEVYRNKTENLLSNLDVSRTTGDTRVYRNVGAIENKGIEATVRSVNFKNDDFSWETTLIASKNKNKILKLYNNIPKNFNNTRWEEGQNTNTFYLVRWAGVDPRDGSPLWYDANDNITREYSTANRVTYKNSTPDVYGSITNMFSYKNFSLRVQASYNIGGYAFSSFGRHVTSDGLNIMSQNQSVNQLDRWTQPGDIALSPKPLWGVSTGSVRHSTRFLYEKTNIRIQNVALTYVLDKSYLDSLGLQNMSLTLIGDNLGVWTKYNKKNRNTYKNNMSGYPMETTISLGLDVSF